MINIYTDGACSGNPGPGGWGFVAVEDSEVIVERSGFETNTTNNRMELTAFLNAIVWAAGYIDWYVLDQIFKVYSDSSYVVNAITKGWLLNWKLSGWKKSDGKTVLNKDLWEQVSEILYAKNSHGLRLIDRTNITWVKGHDGHLGNEHADTIACNARDEAKTMLALTQLDKEGKDEDI